MSIVDEVNRLHQEIARLRERIELNLETAKVREKWAFNAGYTYGLEREPSAVVAWNKWQDLQERVSRQEALNAGREP